MPSRLSSNIPGSAEAIVTTALSFERAMLPSFSLIIPEATGSGTILIEHPASMVMVRIMIKVYFFIMFLQGCYHSSYKLYQINPDFLCALLFQLRVLLPCLPVHLPVSRLQIQLFPSLFLT